MNYLDLQMELTEEDKNLKQTAHEFARDVMRPIARQLDSMSAEEVVADGSPMWDFLKQAYERGYHTIGLPEEMGGIQLTPLQNHIFQEEMGWGSFGLGVLLLVARLPFGPLARLAQFTGNMELVDLYVKPFCECKDGSIRGCLAVTEPDHGSDIIGGGRNEDYFKDPGIRSNVKARLEGDQWVLTGQKSAWVSGGTIATHALLMAEVDPSMGLSGRGIFACPLNIEGVTKGRPLEKIGQRDLNQGEIFFDDARIPTNHLIMGPVREGQGGGGGVGIAGTTDTVMGNLATGLARAAFEEAFGYARVRVQGGKPIIEHNSIRQRLFEMFAKVEACRSFSRAVHLYGSVVPLPEYGDASQILCTQLAYEVADEAVQILGGNGLAREYLPEKLYRDARATLIEHGNNEILAANGGKNLNDLYPRAR